MICRTTFTVTILFLFSTLQNSNAQESPAKHILRATVQIELRDNANKLLATGSGVIVSPDGYILTAKHILADHFKSPDTTQVLVRRVDDNLILLQGSRITEIIPESFIDIALLHLPSDGLPFLKIGQSSILKWDEKLVAYGFGLGSEQVLAKFGHRSGLTWEVDIPVSDGFSGGPVIKEGCPMLIGIVSGGLQAAGGLIQGRSKIVPSQFGINLLAQAGVTPSSTLCGETVSTVETNTNHKDTAPLEPPLPCKEVTVTELVNGIRSWSKKCL